jgi:ADP-ribose pyrophosphatase
LVSRLKRDTITQWLKAQVKDMITETLYTGKHLTLKRTGHWEYVTRNRISGIVGIVAVAKGRELLLVEQFRIPVGKNVIELPAGLVGDIEENESLEVAAQRELWEETGYEAKKLTRIHIGTSSAGLTSEMMQFFLADELEKTGEGGGDESEEIWVHQVPLDGIDRWLAKKGEEGRLIDFKVYAGLYWLIGKMSKGGG